MERQNGDSAPAKSGDVNAAHQAAVKYLARREHSQAELRGKLARRFAADAIAAAIDKLAADGTQSDERFAAAFVRMRRRKFGAYKIAAELRARGVSAELTKRALATPDDGDFHPPGFNRRDKGGESDDDDAADGKAAEIARARAVLAKRFGEASGGDAVNAGNGAVKMDAKEYARRWRFLQARGFSAAVVGAVLRRRS